MRGRWFVLLPLFIFLGWYFFSLKVDYFIFYMILLYIGSWINMHFYLADIYRSRLRYNEVQDEKKYRLYKLYLEEDLEDFLVWWDITKVIKHTKDPSFIYIILPLFLIIIPLDVVEYTVKYTNKVLLWLDNNLKI